MATEEKFTLLRAILRMLGLLAEAVEDIVARILLLPPILISLPSCTQAPIVLPMSAASPLTCCAPVEYPVGWDSLHRERLPRIKSQG